MSLNLSNFDLTDYLSGMQFHFGSTADPEDQTAWQFVNARIIPEPTSLLLLGTGLGILWLEVNQRR